MPLKLWHEERAKLRKSRMLYLFRRRMGLRVDFGEYIMWENYPPSYNS